MLFNKFDSYYYSRPVSYRSYNPRVVSKDILPINDKDTQEVIYLLKQRNIQFEDFGGLHRGIRFDDFEVGKRKYNHNKYNVGDQFYIHQWKKSNDLAAEHLTGTHLVFKSFPEFLGKLVPILDSHRKK